MTNSAPDCAATTPPITVINPYTQERVAEVTNTDAAGVAQAVHRALEGARLAKTLSRYERSEILTGVAHRLKTDAETFAQRITAESGKVIRQARKEAQRAITTLTLSAHEATRLAGEEIPFDAAPGDTSWTGYARREPVGPILGITPFNDPLNLVAHKVGPAIAAGNSIVIKPSELAPLSAMYLAELFYECGLPEPVLQVITGDAQTAKALVASDVFRMISFTGGEATANAIVRSAGVKRYSMDLGGNAPTIVCDDTDIDLAAAACVSGAFWANGHNCVSVQRIIAEAGVYHLFCAEFCRRVDDLKVGDPTLDGTDLGPVVNAAHADRIMDVLNDARSSGVSVLRGGGRSGNVLDPIVLTGAGTACQAWRNEAFGPLVVIALASSFEQAVAMANDTPVALHAGVFTNDIRKAHTAADALSFSGVMINETSDFRFDGMPFGGFKRGGVGREGVGYAVREMTQEKTVAFHHCA